MQTSSHLDYITISYVAVNSPSELGFLDGGVFGAVESIQPFRHYDLAFRLRCGGTLNVSQDKMQGSRLDLSGEPLQNLRDAGLSDAQILFVVSDTEMKKRTTRIDYCWNIADAGSVRHTLNHYRAGKVETVFRKPPGGYIDFAGRKGWSLYYGSRQSEQFVRVYDKGTELGLLNQALLRVEMQIRTPHAGTLYEDCVTSNIKLAMRSKMRSLLHFPHLQWWLRTFEGELMDNLTVPRKMPAFQRWLSGQVEKSIRQHYEKNDSDDRQFINKWLAKLSEICKVN